MSVMSEREMIAVEREASGLWWLFLATGVAWVVVAFLVLTFDPTTPATVGYIAGFILIAAGVNELMTVGLVAAWKWLHALLGVLFSIAGIMALMSPFQTFGVLALLIGWYLIAKGVADVIVSIVERDELAMWGLMLAAGILQLAIGVWAVGYPGRSAWLLVLWVGTAALIRGITEIVLGFKLRGARLAR
jgi:uncharacterized membrane protein HdeD (DUF308 family)